MNKDTKGKVAWEIFPFKECEEVVRVFEHGAAEKKYGAPFTYRQPIGINKLAASTIRHAIAILNGIQTDPESNLSHFAHIAANGLMGVSQLQLPPSATEPNPYPGPVCMLDVEEDERCNSQEGYKEMSAIRNKWEEDCEPASSTSFKFKTKGKKSLDFVSLAGTKEKEILS
jgi:hypothetical protein